jgi:hypothetical protein
MFDQEPQIPELAYHMALDASSVNEDGAVVASYAYCKEIGMPDDFILAQINGKFLVVQDLPEYLSDFATGWTDEQFRSIRKKMNRDISRRSC